MQVTVKYFGLLAEVTSCKEEVVDFTKTTARQLLEQLYITYPALKGLDFQIAQERELISPDTKINGTEIALLPPFSGG
jgi:molybdopterin synthase sulfur carrier subunit